MTQIIPVDDKLKQQRYCILMNIPFDLSLMAYVALNGETMIGICQFELSDDLCRIVNLAFDKRISATSIPFMLLRSVMHFADSCGIEQVELCEKYIDDRLAESAGFFKSDNGLYLTHLQNFGRYTI